MHNLDLLYYFTSFNLKDKAKNNIHFGDNVKYRKKSLMFYSLWKLKIVL